MLDTNVNLDDIKKVCNEPGNVTYCVMASRPGVMAWLVDTEYTKFKPDTDANEGFHLAMVKWPDDCPLVFIVASFKQEGQEYADSILEKYGLKKVGPGHVMTMLGGGGAQKFPIEGPNVFYLENAPGNVIYTNDKAKIDEAHTEETRQAQKFFSEHEVWLTTPEGKATYDAYWSKHPSGISR